MKKINLENQLNLFSEEDFEGDKLSKESVQSDSKVVNYIQLENNSNIEYDHTALFERLAKSDFRAGFHLKPKDIEYIETKGMTVIRQHAADFVAKRLAPQYIPNDGKQTPMRGHPVFLAQHATGCCCRGCFEKWHHIPAGRPLTAIEQNYAVSVLMYWIQKEYKVFKTRKSASD